EMRYLPSGEAVTSFSVAVSERFKTRDGQQQERTTWFSVSAFGRLADIANQYLKKGSSVYLEGPVQQREYTDRDGVARTSLDGRVRELKLLAGRGDDEGAPSEDGTSHDAAFGRQPVAARAAISAEAALGDDIPF